MEYQNYQTKTTKMLYHLEYNEEQDAFHYNMDTNKQPPYKNGWKTITHCETLEELHEAYLKIEFLMVPGKKYSYRELQKLFKQ